MVSLTFPYLLACQCYKHADSCHYNKSLDHGICDDCYHNTTGMFCEQCVLKFYRNMSKPLDDPEVCLREYCFSTGFCIHIYIFNTTKKICINLQFGQSFFH